jgi:uncharacterized paraquat-inducible protein A
VKACAVVAKLMLALCGFSALSFAQFSPGALSKAHTKLDAPTHCTSCHVNGGGGRKFKCTNCHLEIEQRLAQDETTRRGTESSVPRFSQHFARTKIHT